MDTGGTLIYGTVTFIFQSQRLLFAFERSSVGYSACKLSKNGIRAAELLKIITRVFFALTAE